MNELEKQLKEKISKHVADTIGHGMSEKCDRQAEITIDYLLSGLSDNFQLVPKEPSEEMIEAFWGEITQGQPEMNAAKEAYRDMLSASQESEE